MKKIVSIMFCTTLLAAGLYGQIFPLSAGAGGLIGYTFTRYTMTANGSLDPVIDGNIELNQTMDRFNYGGFLFFDATYGEFAVSIRGGQNAYGEIMDQRLEGGSWATVTDDRGTGSEVMIGFSLLGKYPFRVNEKITWFPLIGVEYQMALLEQRTPDGDTPHDRTAGELDADLDKDGNSYALKAWNTFTIDLGAGFDYQITGRIFLRNELLFSFRLKTPYETGALEMSKAKFRASDVSLVGLTGGPTLRTSVGYRLSDRK
jgi:opacity protein-like surface antigen